VTTDDVLDRLRAHDGEKIWYVKLAIDEIERLRADVKAVIVDERERCCTIVHGVCSSDNEATRIVNAIRGKK
jgi:hypothetical protein